MPKKGCKNICVKVSTYEKAETYVTENRDRLKSVASFVERAIETAIERGV